MNKIKILIKIAFLLNTPIKLKPVYTNLLSVSQYQHSSESTLVPHVYVYISIVCDNNSTRLHTSLNVNPSFDNDYI